MVIEYSGSTSKYTGPHSKKYRIDRSDVEKHKRDLTEKLGPNYEKYFRLNFILKSQIHVIYHITGRNEFTSRSKYGNKKYTAFRVNKDVDTTIQNYNQISIDKKKRIELEKEINYWNGQRYYYTSPAGRHISRSIKTSRRDFKITLKSLLEVKRPQKIDVYSKLAPKNKKNIVNTSNRNKMCVKCGSIFNPIDWSNWTIKYLSTSDVYVCENCNKELKNSIVLEKLNRVKYETRTSNLNIKSNTLKKLLYVSLGIMIITPLLLAYLIPILIIFLLSLAGITTYLTLKLKKLSKILREEKNLEDKRKFSVCNNIKQLDIKEELKEKQQNQKIKVVSKKIVEKKTKYIYKKINCEVCKSELEILSFYSRGIGNRTIYYCSHCDLNKCALVSCNNMCKSKFCSKECRKKAYKEPTIPYRIPVKSTLNIKSNDFNNYSFESFIIYNSNNEILAKIPKERFIKEDANFHYCKCGKSYVNKTFFYYHLTNSVDCINLFLTDEKRREISEENIIKILNNKPQHFNDISLKFQIKDEIVKKYLHSKLKKLMREGTTFRNVVGKDEYWKLIPSTVPGESKDLITSPKQKIEPLKAKSYDFNGFILTIYDSNDKKLATIPREQFNKKNSSLYYCKCGKYYLSSSYFFKHLLKSTDCINLFLLNKTEEKISSRTIKTTPKIEKTKELKDQEKTQLLEISEKNILKTLNDKPIIFKDLSSKFIIKDKMDERELRYKLYTLVRKEYASQEFVNNIFYWKLNPTYLRVREKEELTEKDSVVISSLKNYSYYPKTLICYKNSYIIIKKGIYNFIPEISHFLKTLDVDLKREFFKTEVYKWRRKYNILNLNSDRKKEEYVSILNQDLEEPSSLENDVVLLLDLNKNLIFYKEGDPNLDIIVKSDWASYNTISTSKESFKKKINDYLS